DYQELAPLPGGNLGTSSQSEILHAKNRAKSLGLFVEQFEHMMNWAGILPPGIEFRFGREDSAEQEQKAKVSKLRAEARELMRMNGELTAKGARQMALEAGDIPQEVADAMDAETDERTVEGRGRVEDAAPPNGDQATGQRAIDPERLVVEDAVARRAQRGLDIIWENFRQRVGSD
ncbi:MAG: hypothetical protein ACOC9T_01045, partial [Myxococcota bacterium]